MRTENLGGRRAKWCLCLAALALALFAIVDSGAAQGPRGLGRRGTYGRRHGMRRPGGMMRREQRRQEMREFIRYLMGLRPEEQERVMATDARFLRLPPQRQERIRERLRRWNALSPEQKQRIRERQEVFSNLSPAQRQEARQIYPEWQRLPPERRRELTQAFRKLRDLPPNEREKFLSSPDTEKRFSPEERDLLARMSRLLPERRESPQENEEPQR